MRYRRQYVLGPMDRGPYGQFYLSVAIGMKLPAWSGTKVEKGLVQPRSSFLDVPPALQNAKT